MDDTTKHIIRSLARRQPRDVIITDLCDRYRLAQTDAERLVTKIELEHQNIIVKRLRPSLILLWGALALSGFSLTAFMVFAALNDLKIYLFQDSLPYLGNSLFSALGLLACWGGTREIMRLTRKTE